VKFGIAARRRVLLPGLGLVLLLSLLALAAEAQSGRRKSEVKKNPGSIDTAPVSTEVKTAGQAPAPPVMKGAKTTDSSDDADVVRVMSNLVPVPASVVDEHGAALTNLKLEDFELRVDGQLRTISDMSRSETPVRLAMLFDNSGSLTASREMEKLAARRFFGRVLRLSIDQAAIYSVATESYLAQPLTNDLRRLEFTIDSFGKPEGGTCLFDAIVDAAVYLRPYKARKVIVIVSDGADTISKLDFETTMQRVLAENCEIYVVQTGLYDNANVRDLVAERRMEALATQTGGAVHLPKAVYDLDRAFEQIAADLAQQYVLSYYATDERRDGQYHSIALRVKTHNDARVRSRRGFYAPRA